MTASQSTLRAFHLFLTVRSRCSIHLAASNIAADAASIHLAERRCSPEPALFNALREETAAAFPGGAHMVSGVQQGRLLHTLVRLSRAQRVLEVGCFTGYAALWMALGLPEDGTLLSLERDERCAEIARRHFESAGVASRVELRMGDAFESLEAIPRGSLQPFDLIFLDADKKRTAGYFELLMDRGLLAPHSLLLVDNVLWKGHVLDRLNGNGNDDDQPAAATAKEEGAARRFRALRDALHDFSCSSARMRGYVDDAAARDGLTFVQLASPWEVFDVLSSEEKGRQCCGGGGGGSCGRDAITPRGGTRCELRCTPSVVPKACWL